MKDGRQLLRLAQPVGKELLLGAKSRETAVMKAQESLELVRLRLEETGYSNPSAWPSARIDLENAASILKTKGEELLVAPAVLPEQARLVLLEELTPKLDALALALKERDVPLTMKLQEDTAAALGKLRGLSFAKATLPYEIPSEYSSLPRLMGRAKIEMKIQSLKGFRTENGKKYDTDTIIYELDGYHAPLTAGSIMDLVMKKFYDGMSIQRAEELIVQTGSTIVDKDAGYVDPKTNLVRTIPLEIFYKNDASPVYGITSDDDNRATDTKALPFQAYGALGMGRSNEDPDSASSQFFFLKWLQALVAPGRNTLDGYYSCFGYVVQNEELLSQLQVGDKIIYAKVIEGAENFVPHSKPLLQTSSNSITYSSLVTAKSISKSDFLKATSEGSAIDVRDKKAMAKEVKTLENAAGLKEPKKSPSEQRNEFADQLKLYQTLKKTEAQQKQSAELFFGEFLPMPLKIVPVASADEGPTIVLKGGKYDGISAPTEAPKKYNKYGKLIEEKMIVDPNVNEKIRLVDLGGSRGARGLASNGVQGGSLVDQLKAYGGPGAPDDKYEDKSLKNPLKYKSGIEDQLKVYQKLQGQ